MQLIDAPADTESVSMPRCVRKRFLKTTRSCNGEHRCALIRDVERWVGHHVGEDRLIPTPPVMICASIAGCQVVQMWRCESQSSIRVRGRLVWRKISQDDHEAIAGPQ
ncbi:hypothetical protein GGP41_000624 [Bipolaris sorokiniana]|uniref:Uncharacterized protein n=1 Tax=Cochliobolus sativus TaxID=45130 RepID=A0A8H5ZQB7_COCSA|nr:hypothetical protein GGP41_000624 [Bipolaris sorokiniana]